MDEARAAMRRVRPAGAADRCRQELAKELVKDLDRMDKQMQSYAARIEEAVTICGSRLTQVQGIGTILAGKILAETGDVARFANADHYASYAGTAPVETSSGDNRKQRLNPGGNRRLNAVLHIMAVVQIQNRGPGQTFYLKKIAEGKTPREARRALKRRLTNVIFRILTADAKRLKRPAS